MHLGKMNPVPSRAFASLQLSCTKLGVNPELGNTGSGDNLSEETYLFDVDLGVMFAAKSNNSNGFACATSKPAW